MRYLLLLFSFISFSQTQIDLDPMTSPIHLGEPVGFEAICDGVNELYVTNKVHFNGSNNPLTLNGVTLTINDGIEFGGSFKGYCGSKLIISGEIKNSDPIDPGGNPFDLPDGSPANTINVPNPYFVDTITVTLPDDVSIGWYGLYELIETERQNLLSIPVYHQNTNRLAYDGLIDVYDMTGRKILSKVSPDLSNLSNGVYTLVTEENHKIKIIR